MSNHKYLLHNIRPIVNYGFRCHGDQLYNHTTLPDQTRTYLDGFLPCNATQSAVMRLHVVLSSVGLSVPLSVCL